MKSNRLRGILLILALALAACSSAPAYQAPAAAATAGIPVTGATTVNIGGSTDFGPHLVNSEGFSLYVFMHDTQNSGASTCTDADGCTTDWPPLLSAGDPVAGEGVDGSLLGTITRNDGRLQVTYIGWPVYQFSEDKAAGDTNGEGLNEFGGLWFLISPAGEAIQH